MFVAMKQTKLQFTYNQNVTSERIVSTIIYTKQNSAIICGGRQTASLRGKQMGYIAT